MALLEIRNLEKVYPGGTRALNGVSLDVAEGEFVSVIGLSGSGKTTLVRCINRLVEPTKGQILFEEQDVLGLRGRELRRLRTRIGMVFQHYNLVPRLSVIENVLHGRLGHKSTLRGMVGWYERAERADAVRILGELGLEEQTHKRCDQLSGGQKQRVGIARALIQHPRLILCDEPVASLDPNSSRTILETLRRINRDKGISCILNLHQVDLALRYSDRLIGIRAGECVYDGPPERFDLATARAIYGDEYDPRSGEVSGDA